MKLFIYKGKKEAWLIDSQTPKTPNFGSWSPKPVSRFGSRIPKNWNPRRGQCPKHSGFWGLSNQKQSPMAGRKSSRRSRGHSHAKPEGVHSQQKRVHTSRPLRVHTSRLLRVYTLNFQEKSSRSLRVNTLNGQEKSSGLLRVCTLNGQEAFSWLLRVKTLNGRGCSLGSWGCTPQWPRGFHPWPLSGAPSTAKRTLLVVEGAHLDGQECTSLVHSQRLCTSQQPRVYTLDNQEAFSWPLRVYALKLGVRVCSWWPGGFPPGRWGLFLVWQPPKPTGFGALTPSPFGGFNFFYLKFWGIWLPKLGVLGVWESISQASKEMKKQVGSWVSGQDKWVYP
jgi:hypothetical protein